ncbi:MAG: hypothetical protein V3W14_06640 [Candidatus Neomarinimicrobiota bacterium]
MKRLISIFALSALMWGCGAPKEITWFQGTFSEAQATAGDRMIMLDFFTEW